MLSSTTASKIANNPFLQGQAAKNPDINDLLTKASSGAANLAQVRQLAGWASGAEAGQQQRIATQQAQAQADFTKNQAAAQQAAATNAANARQALKDSMGPQPSPAAQAILMGAQTNDLGATQPSPLQTPPDSVTIAQRFLSKGVEPTPEINQFLTNMTKAEDNRIRTQELASANAATVGQRADAAADKNATRSSTPTFTTDPDTGITMASLNGQMQQVNKPVKATSMAEKLAAAKQLKDAMDSGDFDTAQEIGMAMGHHNGLTGLPLTAADYQTIAAQGKTVNAGAPGAPVAAGATPPAGLPGFLTPAAARPVVAPPAAAIAALKANPQLAQQFDAKYGIGTSKRALGIQ